MGTAVAGLRGDETLSRALARKFRLVKQINDAHSANPVAVPFTAVGSGSSFAITCTQPGTDGNTIQFQELHKTSTMALLPAGASKMTGGTDPTSMHVRIDFSALGLRACGRPG